ncbi:MAG: hypothetical protein V1784_11775, partial [bacterium]
MTEVPLEKNAEVAPSLRLLTNPVVWAGFVFGGIELIVDVAAVAGLVERECQGLGEGQPREK